MNLLDAKTHKRLVATIETVSSEEQMQLKHNKHFIFDWSILANCEVYKIKLIGSEEILGLLALIDYPSEFRIHIELIESSKNHRGKAKPILNIPACLIAFACKESFKRGYDGFVSLIPKTNLIDYYRKHFGFLQFGAQLAIFEEISEAMIEKYIGNEAI